MGLTSNHVLNSDTPKYKWLKFSWNGCFIEAVILLYSVWGRFKNTYELLNPRAFKISMLYKNRTFQCMG